MIKSQPTLDLADKLIDAGHLHEAIELYKKILTSGDINHTALANLKIIQPLEHLQFSEQLLEQYPDSKHVTRYRILLLLEYRLAKQAIELCNNTLKNFDFTPIERSQYVTLRFKAGLQAGITDDLKEDFITIWQSLRNAKGKQKLLQDLLAVADTTFQEVFVALSQEQIFTESLRQVFAEKAQVLGHLKQLADEDFA